MGGIVLRKCSIGSRLQENALTIREQGLISVPTYRQGEGQRGPDRRYGHHERTMASFWSKVWAGRAFFYGMPSGGKHIGMAEQEEVSHDEAVPAKRQTHRVRCDSHLQCGARLRAGKRGRGSRWRTDYP